MKPWGKRTGLVVIFLISILGFQNCTGGFSASKAVQSLGPSGNSTNNSTSSSASSGVSNPGPTNPTGAAPAGTGVLTKVISPVSANVPAGYTLTFDDEFTSLNLSDTDGDGAKWHTFPNAGCMDAHSDPTNPATYMALTTSPVNNYSIVPGVGLDLALTRAPSGWYGSTIRTTDSQGKGFAQTFGYFEMRAKLPNVIGTWPAFWTIPVSSWAGTPGHPSEIDIFEHYSAWPTALSITLHDWANNPQPMPSYNPDVGVNMQLDYHIYGMLWTAQSMTFYFDNNVIWSVANPPALLNEPQAVIIDLGLGGAGDDANGPRNPVTGLPNRTDMLVDYVRIYKAP